MRTTIAASCLLTLALVASCGDGERVNNALPVANAGNDQNVTTGSLVTLIGTGSSDVDLDPLTYTWTILAKPQGSGIVLSDVNAVKPTFTPDYNGEYVINLVVNDGTADSTQDKVTISSHSFILSDTGADYCFDPAGGGPTVSCPSPGEPYAQDASFVINPPDFVDNQNGTITDMNTRLIWEKGYSTFYRSDIRDDHCIFEEYCSTLTVGVIDNWRVPTHLELLYFYDYSYDFSYKPMPPDENLIGEHLTSGSHMVISLGAIGRLDLAADNSWDPGWKIKCVSGSTPPQGELQLQGDGTYIDTLTKLQWVQVPNGLNPNWEENLQTCNTSTISGHSDWRVPNIKELGSVLYQEDVIVGTDIFSSTMSLLYENDPYVIRSSSSTDSPLQPVGWHGITEPPWPGMINYTCVRGPN